MSNKTGGAESSRFVRLSRSEKIRLDVFPVLQPFIMGRETGHHLLVETPDFGPFFHVELAALRHGLDRVVHLGDGVQTGMGITVLVCRM